MRPFRRSRLDQFLSGRVDLEGLLGFQLEDREELLFEAQRRLGEGEVDAAERLFLVALTSSSATGPRSSWASGPAPGAGDLSTAISHYEAVLGLRPADPYAAANLAECSLLLGDQDAARGELERVSFGVRDSLPDDMAARFRSLSRLASEIEPSGAYPAAGPWHRGRLRLREGPLGAGIPLGPRAIVARREAAHR